jgi:putative phosphoribosyl transferase
MIFATKPRARFKNRAEAGRCLAPLLATRGFAAPVVFGLPRGGVPVAIPIAAALGAPLDLILVRKLGVPWQPELGFGALAEGLDQPLINQEVVAHAGLTEEAMAPVIAREKAELVRRAALYLAGRKRTTPKGRIAILVDDGLATGFTARAALQALRKRGAAQLVLAVPVAAPESIAALKDVADEIIAVEAEEFHGGISASYDDFHQISDAEMLALLAPSSG